MEVSEIFAELKKHILEGMVFHDEMMRYYKFLNCDDWAEEHLNHYNEETRAYHNLADYYINHYNMLIPTLPMERPDTIPEVWYRYARQEVDINTKTNAMRVGVRKWVEWEEKTKALYQDMCKELFDMNEIAAYYFVLGYVHDVDNELKEAQNKHIFLESIGYDLKTILSEQ